MTQFYCTNCGNEKFIIPQYPKPDDKVICKKCNAYALYKDIKKHIDDETAKDFKNIFGAFFGTAFAANKKKKRHDKKN